MVGDYTKCDSIIHTDLLSFYRVDQVALELDLEILVKSDHWMSTCSLGIQAGHKLLTSCLLITLLELGTAIPMMTQHLQQTLTR